MNQALLKFLSNALGDALSEDGAAAYLKLLAAFESVVEAELAENDVPVYAQQPRSSTSYSFGYVNSNSKGSYHYYDDGHSLLQSVGGTRVPWALSTIHNGDHHGNDTSSQEVHDVPATKDQFCFLAGASNYKGG